MDSYSLLRRFWLYDSVLALPTILLYFGQCRNSRRRLESLHVVVVELVVFVPCAVQSDVPSLWSDWMDYD